MTASPTQNNWADVTPLDADTEKMLSSFFPDNAANSSNDIAGTHVNSFAGGFTGSFNRSLSDNASIFGLSPSAPMGVSPGLASFYQDQTPSKLVDSWSLPSDFSSAAVISSDATGMYSTFGDSMVPALSNGSTRTPSDATSLQSDMLHPLGTVPTSVPQDDVMLFGESNKDSASTPLLSPTSPFSVPSPSTANNTLTGYHSNIATDHAHHLAGLVKTSTILNAGHPGPRSLASSLSRSVLNADAVGRADASAAHGQPKGLTIQQRRRLSHMNQVNDVAAPVFSQAQQAIPTDHVAQGRRRQNSAPDPIMPHVGSSPELHRVPSTPTTPSKRKRSHRSSVSIVDSAPPSHTSVPSSDDDTEGWNDAIVANSHDLVFVLSLKGTVLYMSPSVQRILGFSAEEIVGRPLVDFSHPADVGPFMRELKEAITAPGDEEGTDRENTTAVKAHRRVDLIMRMACKNGTFSLIETTGRVSVDPPKSRKVVVCSGRPHPIPMLPWNDVREDLLTSELSAWLKISHNGIFLGATGPIQQILGIEDISLLGRHVRDLPMVTSSSDLLDALRSGRCISVQDHYEGSEGSTQKPVKLTVYPWTSNGRSNSVSFVHVQQQPATASSASPAGSTVPAKRKASSQDEMHAANRSTGSGSLSGSTLRANGTSKPAMTANDAANTVFSELTGFHSGSWLIEMQRLTNANRRLRHELSALRGRSPLPAAVNVAAC